MDLTVSCGQSPEDPIYYFEVYRLKLPPQLELDCASVISLGHEQLDQFTLYIVIGSTL